MINDNEYSTLIDDSSLQSRCYSMDSSNPKRVDQQLAVIYMNEFIILVAQKSSCIHILQDTTISDNERNQYLKDLDLINSEIDTRKNTLCNNIIKRIENKELLESVGSLNPTIKTSREIIYNYDIIENVIENIGTYCEIPSPDINNYFWLYNSGDNGLVIIWFDGSNTGWYKVNITNIYSIICGR